MMGDEGDGSHEVIIQALRQAGEDSKVKVVLIRVDSPGGSALASDLIWREIMRLREEKQKKIIVSMGSMATSGGYYVACPADRVLAMPLTYVFELSANGLNGS
jgi:protease IV